MRTRREQAPDVSDHKGRELSSTTDPNFVYRHFEKSKDRDTRLAKLKDQGYTVAKEAESFLLLKCPKDAHEARQEAARNKSESMLRSGGPLDPMDHTTIEVGRGIPEEALTAKE